MGEWFRERKKAPVSEHHRFTSDVDAPDRSWSTPPPPTRSGVWPPRRFLTPQGRGYLSPGRGVYGWYGRAGHTERIPPVTTQGVVISVDPPEEAALGWQTPVAVNGSKADPPM